jgi:hypothetical protein
MQTIYLLIATNVATATLFAVHYVTTNRKLAQSEAAQCDLMLATINLEQAVREHQS